MTSGSTTYGYRAGQAGRSVIPKPVAPFVSVKRVLEQSFREISAIAPLVEGEESRAFAFPSGDEDYVLRVNYFAEGFDKDDFCYRKFAKRNLPIPEVIGIYNFDGCFYCVSRRLKGRTLQDLPPKELPAIVAPVETVMRIISGADLRNTCKFGPFDSHGIGRYESWRDFLFSIVDQRIYDRETARASVDMDKVKPLLNQVAELIGNCPEDRHLVHGDFGSNNVLTDAHRITGVLDWSEALFGDPLYDVANILFWRTTLDCMEHQARFICRRLATGMRPSERLRCYQLRIGLEEIYRSAICGAPEKASWATLRCYETAFSEEACD